jgi:hypothetical protein
MVKSQVNLRTGFRLLTPQVNVSVWYGTLFIAHFLCNNVAWLFPSPDSVTTGEVPSRYKSAHCASLGIHLGHDAFSTPRSPSGQGIGDN